MNSIKALKRSLSVFVVLYRQEIRKKLIKLMILMNFAFFIMSIGQNVISVFVFLLNMHYLYNYLKSEYPEEGLKLKDRFKGII